MLVERDAAVPRRRRSVALAEGMMMASLNQFAWVSGTETYRFGHASTPTVEITGTPADADLGRWSMLHDGVDHRFYCFKNDGANNRLYQHAFNGTSYAYGHRSIPELVIAGFPGDTDFSGFAMVHDGANYRIYLRPQGGARALYAGVWTGQEYRYAAGSRIPLDRFPDDTDFTRWQMLHDGTALRFYAFKQGSAARFYQGAFNAATGAFEYGHQSIPQLTLEGSPATSDTRHAAMLHDDQMYRLYYQTGASAAAERVIVADTDLFAVDPAGDFIRSHHRADGTFDVDRVKIGNGWQGYRWLSAARGGHVYTVAPDGRLVYYRYDGTGWPYQNHTLGGSEWAQHRWVGVGRFGQIYALRPDNTLTVTVHDADLGNFTTHTLAGTFNSANTYQRIFAGGSNCLYAVDGAGRLLHWRHDDDLAWQHEAVPIGSGWHIFSALASAGDGEIYGIRASDGALVAYRHRDDRVFVNNGVGLPIATGWGGLTLIPAAR